MNKKPIAQFLQSHAELQRFFPDERIEALVNECEEAKAVFEEEIERIENLTRLTERHEDLLQSYGDKVEALDSAIEALGGLQSSYEELTAAAEIVSSE